ncbi:hypothetical protein ACFW9O_30645 [Streptomyces sp. NPDC059499]|uniref:hypothetical protein n=1 Tax=Streptomyces sp. NPDC059499 TaxID=3346852 RepID=UPI003688E0D2
MFAMRRPLLDEDTVAQRVAARLDRQKLLALESTYGVLRAQAMTPNESLAQVEMLLGEL